MELKIELEFLQEINLSNNYLNYIHPNAFKELTKLKNLYIDNNEVSFTLSQSEPSIELYLDQSELFTNHIFS